MEIFRYNHHAVINSSNVGRYVITKQTYYFRVCVHVSMPEKKDGHLNDSITAEFSFCYTFLYHLNFFIMIMNAL